MNITQNRTEKRNGELHDAASDISSVASNLGHEMNKGVRELGSAVMNASSDIARNIEQSSVDALENLGKSATNATQSLEREIKNSPLISMGVAFGLGLFAARMLRNH